ncbi:MAG: hypothetical protein K9L22_07850 [Methylococcaceae bacterium]|nr:hypothetical protein [Methylococcaceae bacterium]
MFGDKVASRIFEAQVTEVYARIAVMNIMTYLGMRKSIAVDGARLKIRERAESAT